MKENSTNTNKRMAGRVLFYLLGLLILAMGLILNTKAGLGVSPIISVPYCVSIILSLNFGDMTFIMYALLVAAQFAVKGKNRSWADLLQLILSIVFTRFLNLFSALIPQAPDKLSIQIPVLLAAIVLTGVGAAMSVNARLVPNPGDGIVAAISDRSGKDLGFVKNCVDLCCIIISIIIGLIVKGRLVGIGIGTVICVVGVGRCIWAYNRLFKKRVADLSGLGEAA